MLLSALNLQAAAGDAWSAVHIRSFYDESFAGLPVREQTIVKVSWSLLCCVWSGVLSAAAAGGAGGASGAVAGPRAEGSDAAAFRYPVSKACENSMDAFA